MRARLRGPTTDWVFRDGLVSAKVERMRVADRWIDVRACEDHRRRPAGTRGASLRHASRFAQWRDGRRDVRYWGHAGKHLLGLSLSGFDPGADVSSSIQGIERQIKLCR